MNLVDRPAWSPHPDDPLLSVHDLRVWFGTERGPVHAVDGVDFQIRAGETLGLVGESGCGKSTLGRALLGLLPASAAAGGRVVFKGADLMAIPRRQVHALRGPELGLIFQEPMTRLNPLMKISEHFVEAIRTHRPGVPKQQARREAAEALRHVGVPASRLDGYPHEFSGGMRQRIMIALALILRPAFVVADEPTTALDVLVEAQVLKLLAALRREHGIAMLLITHNLGIVAETCDRVAVMYAGELVEVGATADVFAAPRHPYTRELLRSTISLSTTGLHYIPGAPPDLAEPPPACRFHPRCPDAMRVCAAVPPVEVRTGGDHRVSCWLNGPRRAVPEGGGEPLEREEIGVADEA